MPAVVLLLLAGLVVAKHAMAGLGPDGAFAAWLLPDADSWLRVGRVLALREGAGWFDATVARLNAPSGLSLHWTRPLGVLVLLSAVALERALGLAPRDAVLLAGAWICPVLHAACAATAVWAACAVWTGIGPLLAGMLVAAAPVVGGYSALGRADHHTLILLAGLLALGAAARAAARPAEERAAAWWAGGFAGPACGSAPKRCAPPRRCWPVSARSGSWKGRGGVPTAGAAAQGLRASLGFTAAVAVEHPPSAWLDGDYDKVSAQHALMGVLAAAVFWAAPKAAGGGGAGRRPAGLPARRAERLPVRRGRRRRGAHDARGGRDAARGRVPRRAAGLLVCAPQPG